MAFYDMDCLAAWRRSPIVQSNVPSVVQSAVGWLPCLGLTKKNIVDEDKTRIGSQRRNRWR